MKEHEFRAYGAESGLTEAQIEAHLAAVRDFESFLTTYGSSRRDAGPGGTSPGPAATATATATMTRPITADTAGARDIAAYLASLLAEGPCSRGALVGLALYGYGTGNYALYLYLVGILSGRQVVPRLADRTRELAGDDVHQAVFANLETPSLGSPQESYTGPTRRLVEGLRARLPEDECRHILAGNNHGIPRSAHANLRRTYRRSGIDAVLRLRHKRLVAELEQHARSGKPWYEQMIDQAVVDYVRRNPEIQAGVRQGSSIFVSKIPYDPVAYLAAADPKTKRYYQCHCPLARASILQEGPAVPALWCYCSGGFEKLAFDVVFQQPVKVEVLESALAGDARCRFRIEIPEECRPSD